LLFVELRFFYFLVAVLAIHWALRNDRARKVFLLAASYAFYAAWDYRFLSLILISTLVDYAAGIGMARAGPRRRLWLLVSLIVNLGLLGVFKYYDFFGESAVALGTWLGVPLSYTALNLVLPVGISFYTFQTLSYSIDVYRGRLAPTRDLFDLALFVAFFPQLVAGPIVRATEFLPQLRTARRREDVPLRACLGLFLVGFVKKACVSDNLSPFVDAYFANPAAYDVFASWIATLFYSIQIYCDFSGYSDMAIASAGLLGYRLCPNFHAPYLSPNITEFWRRWHISLSSWLRDYLYIPLGGNRGSRAFTHRNLMITMLLGGLWHGAAANFVIWGALHGLALVVHREWRRLASPGVLPRPVATGFTFLWVCVAWIFFRAPTFDVAMQICRSVLLFDASGSVSIATSSLLVIAGLAAAHLAARTPAAASFARGLPTPVFAAGYAVLFALALAFAPVDAKPFIYFQF